MKLPDVKSVVQILHSYCKYNVLLDSGDEKQNKMRNERERGKAEGPGVI